MPSGSVLSEEAKNEIREKLQELCEHCWTVYGYKKTSIKELCANAGISIGTFYALYPTKEDLFLETIENIQSRLEKRVLDINQATPTKEGFAQSLKEIFREYDSKPLLYNFNTPDFQSFITKLPDDATEKIKFDSVEFFRKSVQIAKLKLKIYEYEAYGIFSALLTTISAKETLSVTCDYLAVFDFMVDNLMPVIFE